MRRSLIAMCAAAAIATAGTVAVPTKAEAHAWWWIPAAIVGGVVLGAAISGPRAYAAPRGFYEPTAARGEVYEEPRGAVTKRPVRARY
jgi:hypothetical protein